MSFLFNLATDPLGLPVPDIWEYIILAIIGVFAFQIGWDVSPGGTFGSIIHWIVRLGAFIIMWGAVYSVIVAVKFVIAHWVIFVCGVVALAAICVAAAYWWNHRGRYSAA